MKSPTQDHVWLQSSDAALDFFRLRQIQSEWYQTLFQSGRTPWNDPYKYIWQTYQAMTSWFDNISASTLPAFKAFFELDLLYSYVYILSPSPRCPRISEYAQRLIYEHCVTYATKMLTFVNDPSKSSRPFFSFYDAMRTYMTGRQFVDVLARNQDFLLSNVIPRPHMNSFDSNPDINLDPLAQAGPKDSVAPPALPQPSVTPTNQSMRAITAISDFTSILSKFGLRFGYISWRDRFQRESSALLSQLYERAARQSQSQSPEAGLADYNPWAQQPQQQPQQQHLPYDITTGLPAYPNTGGRPRTYVVTPPVGGGSVSSATSQGSMSQMSGVGAGSISLAPISSEWTFGRMPSVSSSLSHPSPFNHALMAGDTTAHGQQQQGQGDVKTPGTWDDLGMMTAWETLPGGSLNARFSFSE